MPKIGLTIYYVGPTLYGCMPEPEPDELWRPPAKQGDILRDALKLKPRQIVLLDGEFHQSLSVWHKEIAYCLIEGVKVIGAASMGALRAADLHRYGMVGIGEIFERYASGATEDDSEVVLDYDPETYRPLSHPKIGAELKAWDALAAVQYARTNTELSVTTLKREAITPYLKSVVDRILES